MLIDWCPRISYAFICLEIFIPRIYRAVVEEVYCNELGRRRLEFLVKVWRYGWAGNPAGDPIPFLLRNLFFIYLNQENSIYDLLSRFCRPFWLSTFYRPWHWGLILNARFSGRFLGSNHRWYMAETRACAHCQMIGIFSLIFLIHKQLESFCFYSFTYFGIN